MEASWTNRFHEDLKERVKELAATQMRYLNDGAAADFSDYKHRVGYLKALGDVLRIADDIAAPAREAR